jgi:hypothetical protein
MRVNKAVETSEAKHTMHPCPICDVITIRQPWASLIALGFKQYEFRSKRLAESGQAMTIHAGSKWYSPEMQAIVRNHFEQFTSSPEQAMLALFPLSVPVAQVTIASCVSVGELSQEDRKYGGINTDDFGIKMTDARIVTQPKPALRGVVRIPWKSNAVDAHNSTQTLIALVSALSRARRLEGAEKNEVYRAFKLPALADKIEAAIQ